MSFDLGVLGVKKNIPKVDFREYSGMFQAESKFGKTQFAALMPNAILVAFEQGYDAQVIDYIDCVGDNSWEKFVQFIDKLEENREAIGSDIKLIIIDTLEEAYRAVEPYMLKKESLKDKASYKKIGDIEFGQGYVRKDNYFREQIKRIYALGFRPLYLTHVELKTIKPKDKNKEPYDIYVPTIDKRCAKIIYPEVSYIIHGKREVIDSKRVRVLQVKGNDETVAGNRVYFDEDIVFDTEEEAIDKFEAKFKEMIKQRLEKNGITTDIDELAKQQEKEKEEQVNQYLKEQEEQKKNEEDLPGLIEEVKTLAKIKKDEGKTVKEISAIIGNPDKYSNIEEAKEILEKLNNL